MKGIDLFCASQASTAICMSMDQASSSSSSSIIHDHDHEQLGGRAIDRHNPIIRDARRISTSGRVTLPSAPCSSQLPINPRPYHQLQKTNIKKKSNSSSKENHDHQKRKSTSSSRAKPAEVAGDDDDNSNIKKSISTPSDVVVRNRKQSFGAKAVADLFTPPGSSRYLLGDSGVYFDGLSDYHHDPVLALVPFGSNNKQDDQAITIAKDKHSSSASDQSKPPSNSNQVVVLRVSLHCKGCEGKVRKHLSRMKGVSSFNIDFAAKKVTVVGDVTPLSVLASVSKVKTAQLWTSAASAASTTATANTENKK
ncbi:hypothetical protein FNV43_RR15955 [Rhamnella rubrinervis]|uniref:HMA domain-containing protein n=1 Tax=Rhamnella rubrinervis TaxID=2594499 RepID=A0A8K0E9U0_9ROSA|nr:hypothetical protein FNV43_RR15955 [Rhamnella rubrinervis]